MFLEAFYINFAWVNAAASIVAFDEEVAPDWQQPVQFCNCETDTFTFTGWVIEFANFGQQLAPDRSYVSLLSKFDLAGWSFDKDFIVKPTQTNVSGYGLEIL